MKTKLLFSIKTKMKKYSFCQFFCDMWINFYFKLKYSKTFFFLIMGQKNFHSSNRNFPMDI